MNSIFSIFTILADKLVYNLLGLSEGSKLADSLHFFVEDVTKISVLVIILIYLIGLTRASMNIEKVRDYLKGKNKLIGYFLAAVFGAVTPFCSCSSIPLFLAFTSARIPIGITMSFLITSPIINEVAVLLLGTMLGWKFTFVYIIVGILAGIVGGYFFDLIKAERHLTPLGHKSIEIADKTTPTVQRCNCNGTCTTTKPQKPSWKKRHKFAKGEVKEIVGRIWKYIILGIAIGAAFHGFVPTSWVENNLGAGNWWNVPIASILGIPLYSNATGIIPIAESMLIKGVPIGTTLCFMMSVVGASFPEFILLKQVMKPKLLVLFFFLLLTMFTLVGWLFNIIAPILNIHV